MSSIRYLGFVDDIKEVDTSSASIGDVLVDGSGQSWFYNGQKFLIVLEDLTLETVLFSESFTSASGQLYSEKSHFPLRKIPNSRHSIEVYQKNSSALQSNEFIYHPETNSIEILSPFLPGEEFEIKYWTNADRREFVLSPMYSPPKKKMKKIKGIVI